MSEKRVVGIRGLDLQIYEQIQELARMKNDNVANIINEALKKYLQNTDEVEYIAPQTVSGQNRFELTAEALIQLSPLRIEDVNTVIVLDGKGEEEITTEMINRDLESINRTQTIYVPTKLYYVILKKAKNVVDVIKYDPPYREQKTLNFPSNTKLSLKILEQFKKENKRLRIIVSGGDLLLEPDIPVDVFEEIISELKVKGNLIVSEDLYASVLTKGSIEGSVQLIDKTGKTVDQIQFGNVSYDNDRETSSKTKKGSKNKQPFNFSFNPGMDTLFDSIEEIKNGIAQTLKNLNIDENFSDAINSEMNKEMKKKRERVKPNKVKFTRKDDSEGDDEDDDFKVTIE